MTARSSKRSTIKAFVAHYQPIIDLTDPRFAPIGAEALVRWKNTTHSLIMPDKLVDMANGNDVSPKDIILETPRAPGSRISARPWMS